MPLFRKFPEIRKFKLHFRKYVTHISVVAMPNNARSFEVQEVLICTSGNSVLCYCHCSLHKVFEFCVQLVGHFLRVILTWIICFI